MTFHEWWIQAGTDDPGEKQLAEAAWERALIEGRSQAYAIIAAKYAERRRDEMG